MKNSITEIVEIITDSYGKNLESMLIERKDISEFVIETKKALDQVGAILIAEALERLDYLVRSDSRRKENWYVKEKAAPNTLATIFGEVHYLRTYYKHKKEKEYRYLSDELVGIEAYDKMDLSLKTKLIEEATDTAYGRSGQKATEALELSRQSVMNAIRELGPIGNDEVEIYKRGVTPDTLYIEADEDHVALQNGGEAEPKLIYVHEGKKEVGKGRWELKNVRYFGGMYRETEVLWNEVADYIEQAYDGAKIENVYLSGDGAKWIKSGTGYINKSVFVLDKYHLYKAIKTAGGHIEHGERELFRAIHAGDLDYAKIVFETILDSTQSETKAKAIRDARTYILNHWESLKQYHNPEHVGCSAEGHVSHIYSDRLSSRPLGWSAEGVDQMSRLRVFKANGGNLFEIALKKKQERRREARIEDLELKMNKAKLKMASGETIDNLPLLSAGKCTQMAFILKQYRGY